MTVQKSPLYRLLAAFLTCAMVLALAPCNAFGEEQGQETLFEPEPTAAIAEAPANVPDAEEDLEGLDAPTDGVDEDVPGEVGEPTTEEDAAGADAQPQEQVLDQPSVEVEQTQDDIAVIGQDDAVTTESAAADIESVVAAEAAEPATVSYRSRVYGADWSAAQTDSEVAGSTSAGAVVNAFKVTVDPGTTGFGGGITYRMHAQQKGWLAWAKDGARGGTNDKLRIEALQIKLYGKLAKKYDVYYSVRVKGKGWLAWAKNGQVTGSTGKALAITGLKVSLVKKGDSAPSSAHVNRSQRFLGNPTVKVSAYVQKKGWLKTVSSGKVAGTTGKRLRLEALRASLAGTEVPGSIMLMGHVQGKGWTGWKAGSVGTTGESKRLEAIAIRLAGEVKKEYDVYYRAHVSKLGWMAWTKNGKKAGTKGFSAPIEAVQIRLVRKGDPAPSQKSKVSAAYYTNPSVSYKAYCQGDGWKGTKKNGASAGTTGEGKRLEAMSVWLSGGTVKGSIKYKSYVAGSGWQGTRSNGETSGTTDQSKAVQAIKISLTGDVAALCDVYYKVHMAEAGWLGWAKNGQVAGAPGVGKNVEAIQVRIVHKGAKAIGSTSYHEVDKSFFDDDMTKKAQGYSSPTGWLIMVDTNKTKLGVYRGSFGNWKKHGSWRISCGQPQTPTIKGVFSVGDRGYVFGHGYSCYWYVQWHGAYLFHSVKYYEGTFNVMDGRLGEHISMGCVRMDIERAKWIYDHIPSGTTVVTY